MAKPKTLPYDAPEVEGPWSVTLHSTAGGSDKIYQVAVEAVDGGWMVNFANGRRGGTMATGRKTPAPVDYAQARKVANATLYDKVGGGYVPIGGSRFGDGMTAEAIATVAKESSGQVPQLVSAVDEDELEALLKDDRYVAQRKHNGDRRFIIVKDGVATGGNRLGQTVALPAKLREAVAGFPDLVLDGEQIGDTFHFWDLLSYKGIDLRPRPFEQRQAALEAGDFARPGVLFATETARGEAAKRALLAQVRSEVKEGIVLKLADAPYDPGRPGGNAAWRKFKLWHSLSAVVEAAKKGRSVTLRLSGEDGAPVHIGAVTIPANHPMPEAGSVVEVRYMYAFPNGGLHQPVFEGARSDIPAADCLASQRVYEGVSPRYAADPVAAREEEAEDATAPAGP